ncbi:MAG: reductive dehalogenase [Calditrichia bacterium]|nr:reductive dehalogenase [Calditrichia bacterium]
MMEINITIIKLISLCLGVFIFLSLITASFISLVEKEKYAAKKYISLAVIVPLPFLMLSLLQFPMQKEILLLLIISTFIFSIILIIPLKNKSAIIPGLPNSQIDERDIMFSRKLLSPGEKNYKEYYSQNPENEKLDNEFRKEPGLLSKKASMYNPLSFASADASFFATEAFKNAVDGEISPDKIEIPPQKITDYLKNWANKLGAKETGITELKDYHLYSKGGRAHNYGEQITSKHKYAIAFTVEMDKQMLACAPAGPTVMESAQQYLNAGAIAVQIAAFIRNLGYSARAHIDGSYQVVCPLVARDAGLGEIGRMGLLMTPKLGPRVRIAVITTDLPLIINKYNQENSVLDFCTICKKCADVCPSQAISFNNMEEINGVKRWQINQESCYTFWTKIGTDCGKCVSVCPYSHPDNLMHNLVRAGLENSFIFRRFALKMDDVLYGRKPAAQKFPDWING